MAPAAGHCALGSGRPVSGKAQSRLGGHPVGNGESESVSGSVCPVLCDPVDYSPPGLSVHGILQATTLEWVGCLSFLQGIFPTQGWNPGRLHCRQILYSLGHQGSPGSEVKVAEWCLTLCNPMGYTVNGILQARTLGWVAFPFSRGSSQPRARTQVSRVAGRLWQTLTNWQCRGIAKISAKASAALL